MDTDRYVDLPEPFFLPVFLYTYRLRRVYVCRVHGIWYRTHTVVFRNLRTKRCDQVKHVGYYSNDLYADKFLNAASYCREGLMFYAYLLLRNIVYK